MTTKLILLVAALFAAASSVAFATGTTYITTVVTTTTTTVNDDSRASWESCQEELMEQIDPDRCRQYFKQYNNLMMQEEEEEEEEGRQQQQQEQEQSVQECCETIRQARPECRCHAIQYALLDVVGGPPQERMFHIAERLPQLCRFQTPSHCSF